MTKPHRKLRMGLIGGGPGSFIGAVHRIAAELDGEIGLVAGAFSSDPARSQAAGSRYGIDPSRAYPSYTAMLAAETSGADRIDFVTIATPNNLHLTVAKAALEAGVAVMSDKPMTATYAEACELASVIAAARVPYRLTYTYTGYPLVREARQLVVDGVIGSVRKVVVEYSQGWLSEPIERSGNKQAEWRTDPKRAGQGGCIGDIGVHAFNLAEFVSGCRVQRISADLNSIVPGRTLDDDCNILLRFDNGAVGALICSQIALGALNGLHFRIYGDKASLEWRQEQPNVLTRYFPDGRSENRYTGAGGLGRDAVAATRLPAGHPEGYLEALANLYRDFAKLLRGADSASLLPGADAGLRGMALISTAVASSREGLWMALIENSIGSQAT